MISIVAVYISIFHSDTSVYRADIVFPITLPSTDFVLVGSPKSQKRKYTRNSETLAQH